MISLQEGKEGGEVVSDHAPLLGRRTFRFGFEDYD